MQINTIAPAIQSIVPVQDPRVVCAGFNGIIYIHAISTLEQRAMNAVIDAIRQLLPQAEVKTVTYDGCDYYDTQLRIKELFVPAVENQTHLIITSGLQSERGRKINSYMLVGIYRSFGLKFHKSNHGNFGKEGLVVEIAKAISVL